MLSEEQVSRVAHLARLSLSVEETRHLTQQLASVLAAFESVSEINTEGVEPLVTPTDMAPFWREDQIAADKSSGAGVEAAMQNAPEVVGNLFKVPPVVG